MCVCNVSVFIFTIFSIITYMFKVELQKARFPNLSLLSSQYEEQGKTEEEINQDYDPFRLLTMQHYTPLYGLFFNVSAEMQNRMTLATKYYFHDLQHVMDAKGKLSSKPVFIKFSPLFDPIRYLIGKYDQLEPLPFIDDVNNVRQSGKLSDTNNSSYVDCFFNYLNGQLKNHHGFVNGLDFYGSFLCYQEKYKFNVSDDLEYLVESKYFIDTINDKYTIENISKSELIHFFNQNLGIEEKEKLCITDDCQDLTDILDIQDLDLDLDLDLDF